MGWKRRVAWVATVAGALLAVVIGRVWLSSRAEYAAGRAAEAGALKHTDPVKRRDGLEEAITHYRRAARWYAPGNGNVTRSLSRLLAIGRLAEQRGDARTALAAYRAVRRATLGARSFYTPHRAALERANRRIAAITARLQGRGQSADAIERYEAWHRKQLARDRAPSVGWAVVALLGFVCWIAGAVLFIFRAITPADGFVGRAALQWGLMILAGWVIWLVGLVQA